MSVRVVIRVRPSNTIHVAKGEIENGTFQGRWHFSFDDYFDPGFMNFGPLRVFNDDTLSRGAIWPLHPHRNIEVVTYCAEGVFRHADQDGVGGVLEKGWVQHTTVGHGMLHSEINDRKDDPMRFIQIWFLPWAADLEPEVEQKRVTRSERTNKLLALVSNTDKDALPINSDARVYSSFLEPGKIIRHELQTDWGSYLYVLEGGPIAVNRQPVEPLAAAVITDQPKFELLAEKDAEILLVDVLVRTKLMQELS